MKKKAEKKRLKRGEKMEGETKRKDKTNLFRHFDIMSFSKEYLKPEIIQKYYRECLKKEDKRTRSDCKILCTNMIQFILLLVLNPEEGYMSVLNKGKCMLLKTTRNISGIANAVTAAGLCKARRRISSKILKKLWQIDVLGNFVKEHGLKLWKGFRVCGFDGTTFTLNKTGKILKEFPLVKNYYRFPKMLACFLYDVYSKIPIDLACGNSHSSERKLLCKILKRIKDKTLLLLDAGYPAYWFIHKLLFLNIEFIIRCPKYFYYKKIKKLGPNDWLVEIIHTEMNNRRCKINLTSREYKVLPAAIILRVFKTKMKGFRARFLLTSLTDDKKYLYEEVCKLYCDRWAIENYYRDLKHLFKIERFHAQYVDGIYQELYAAMILSVILQKYIIQAATIYGVPFEEISFKKTFKLLSDFIYILELLPESEVVENLLLFLFSLNREKKRPGRSYKRIFYRRIKCHESKCR